MNLSDSEIRSLISLLDDDDPEVSSIIQEKILSLGTDVIPFLEREWSLIDNIYHQQKVENVIHQIQFGQLQADLKNWLKSERQDLLEACYLVARYKFPHLEYSTLLSGIEKLRMDAWLEMHYDLSPYERVRILNYVFYQLHGFKGNTESYHDPRNSFLNQVLESKTGNPIMLAVIYMLVAQKLNIPVFGVNLPQHFVLAYMDTVSSGRLDALYQSRPLEEAARDGNVLFYINAFNLGAVFSKANLEQFLKQVGIESKPEFFKPCSNLDILKRILRNLIAAYEKAGKIQNQKEIQELLGLLGEPPLSMLNDLFQGDEDGDLD